MYGWYVCWNLSNERSFHSYSLHDFFLPSILSHSFGNIISFLGEIPCDSGEGHWFPEAAAWTQASGCRPELGILPFCPDTVIHSEMDTWPKQGGLPRTFFELWKKRDTPCLRLQVEKKLKKKVFFKLALHPTWASNGLMFDWLSQPGTP